MAAEQEVAERERLRKEREAKAAEEERLRAKKRTEWWKKNTKWIITGSVLILLCFSAYIFSVNRDSVVASNKNEISIFRFRESTHLIIPKGVTEIEDNAFSDCPSIISVIISNSVTSIGDKAFGNCKGLTSVTIGAGVTTIGREVFKNTNLSSVVWNAKNCMDFEEKNTPFYYSEGFDDRYNVREQITSFSFGEEVEHVPAYLCYHMSNIKSIEMPNNVTTIERDAFSDCKNLTSVSLSKNIINIGWSAFSFCGLTSIEIPNSVTSIEGFAFYCCYNLASCSIANGVERIGEYAFCGCPISSIVIPKSVTTIERDAFYDCKNLNIKLPERFRGKVEIPDYESVRYY